MTKPNERSIKEIFDKYLHAVEFMHPNKSLRDKHTLAESWTRNEVDRLVHNTATISLGKALEARGNRLAEIRGNCINGREQ